MYLVRLTEGYSIGVESSNEPIVQGRHLHNFNLSSNGLFKCCTGRLDFVELSQYILHIV